MVDLATLSMSSGRYEKGKDDENDEEDDEEDGCNGSVEKGATPWAMALAAQRPHHNQMGYLK